LVLNGGFSDDGNGPNQKSDIRRRVGRRRIL
jgi:hypothetical protein